ANIPDVQLPDQYRHNLATRERVAKELVAYEKEWELIRKRKSDALLLEIERAKKERDEKLIAVQEAINNARQRVAQSLQEVEAQAEKIRLDIEAKGRAELKAAEDEATALSRLGRSYKDNQAVLQYELKLKALDVAAELMQQAPRPVVVNSEGGEQSALTTLMLAQMLPNMMSSGNGGGGSARRSSGNLISSGNGGEADDEASLQEQFTQLAKDVAARTASAVRGRRS
ncbi:MAG: hypothetical protein KDE59_20740, partial [Anaerolineales bacterium]|nr:hypothetical protein [Anaerolineales bacterium]